MRRITILGPGLLAGLLLATGCRVATPRQPAGRADAVSNKHILTESPTLEHPAPRPVPGP